MLKKKKNRNDVRNMQSNEPALFFPYSLQLVKHPQLNKGASA